jgi:DNA mismatch repair protein MSH4
MLSSVHGLASASAAPKYDITAGIFETPESSSAIVAPSSSTPQANHKRSANHDTPKTPRTPKPVRTSSYLCALIEYRNHREIGLVAMNLNSPTLIMYQFRDSQRYQSTLMLLQAFDPIEVLLPDNALSSAAEAAISSQFPTVPIQSIKRKYVNEATGIGMLTQVATQASLSSLQLDSTLFLAISSAAALLKYFEFIQSMSFASNSLKVILKTLEGQMRLDVSTVRNLEILAPLNPNSSSRSGPRSLLGVLQVHCKTKMGFRLLRTSLLQPSIDIETIKTRQGTVQAFLDDESLFFQSGQILKRMPDLEHLIAVFIQIPKFRTEKVVVNQLQSILVMRRAMSVVKEIQSVVAKAKKPNSLLTSILEVLSDPIVSTVSEILDKVLKPDAVLTSFSSSENYRTQIIFCIRTGISGLLDVARASYVERVEEIHILFNRYKLEHDQLRSAKLVFNPSRGYHISVPAQADLPGSSFTDIVLAQILSNSFFIVSDILIQKVQNRRNILCSTEALISLDDQRKSNFSEVMRLMGQVIVDVMRVMHEKAQELIAISESIAFFDMLRGFSEYVVMSASNTTCPKFEDSGPIAIKNMMHPIKEKCLDQGIFVPTSLFSDNLTLLFGINASGKTTFLGSTALNVIMAHTGAFIPATAAVLPLVDQVFAIFAPQYHDDTSR